MFLSSLYLPSPFGTVKEWSSESVHECPHQTSVCTRRGLFLSTSHPGPRSPLLVTSFLSVSTRGRTVLSTATTDRPFLTLPTRGQVDAESEPSPSFLLLGDSVPCAYRRTPPPLVPSLDERVKRRGGGGTEPCRTQL